MVDVSSYSDWFIQITGHVDGPRPWQASLGGEATCRNRLIRIPTGLGKTEGVLAAWAYHRIARAADDWPRRLVWCLPMRVLVEQTEQVARRMASRIPEDRRPLIAISMGGEDAGEWFLYPERPAIIIGTQDMLLSRALNRGFGSGRARWPVEFGLLNQDALWVMDETQLMDVGLATSAQLQAFRDQDRAKQLRPCFTWWMSATLQSQWLESVDTREFHKQWVESPIVVPATQRSDELWRIKKAIDAREIAEKDDRALAKLILEQHRALKAGRFGKITLVVCNTVDRACRTFEELKKAGRKEGVELVHSRFRPAERERWREQFLNRDACCEGADRIIVATQVVEAGVDISAGCLITELAPWPSLVQRFGRCARYGGEGRVVVVDRGRGEKQAAPYQPEELSAAWDAVGKLNDAGIAALEAFEEGLSETVRRRLYPYEPSHLLMRKEFDELFDTTPDLTGADLDISRFIRSGDERDLQVFWVEVGKDETPSSERRPHRRELCAIPFLKARDWLCGEETTTKKKPTLRGGMRAWVWDWIDGDWVEANRASLLPGRIVCVAADCGGYRPDRGFDPESNDPVEPVDEPSVDPMAELLEQADDRQDGEPLSIYPWKTIAFHHQEVADEAKKIAQQLRLGGGLDGVLEMAGLWHDWGKSHPAFQGSIRSGGEFQRPDRADLAKAPKECWPRGCLYRFPDNTDARPGFRHELASALGLLALLRQYAPMHEALLGPWREIFGGLGYEIADQSSKPSPSRVVERLIQTSADEFNLIAYLVACHHGKVRVALHASPKDQDYVARDDRGLPIRGVREGDRLPSVRVAPDDAPTPEATLTLSPAAIGLSAATGISWRERCICLFDRFGPGVLAYLEALVRAADVRASRRNTNDPTLASEVAR